MKRLRRIATGLLLLALGLVLIAMLFPLDGFAPHAPRDTNDLLGPRPAVIAHRGGAALAPENTVAAVDNAVSLGVGFEIDVMQCATGEVVVIHDDTLDRTTNGEGDVSSASFDEIRRLDAGAHFDPKFAGVKVPTLEEVLEAGKKTPGILDVEIKTAKPPEPIARAVAKAVLAAGVVERTLVTSFDPYVLEALKIAEPRIRRGQLVGTFEGSDLAWYKRFALSNLMLNGKASPDVIVAEDRLITPGYLERMKSRGYPVLAWTVNERSEMDRLLAMGVDGLITDRPDLLTPIVR